MDDIHNDLHQRPQVKVLFIKCTVEHMVILGKARVNCTMNIKKYIYIPVYIYIYMYFNLIKINEDIYLLVCLFLNMTSLNQSMFMNYYANVKLC